MTSDAERGKAAVQVQAEDAGRYSVDARGGMGVQVGEGNTQIIYSYNRLTWTDGVAPPPLVSVSGVLDSPYRGLSAFEERDAPFFFGREAATTELLERMSRPPTGAGLLVVSGVSGAGKSSLLRAGILPRVRGAGLGSVPGSASWPCLLVTPTRAPLDELALRVALLAGTDAAAVRQGLDADPASFSLTARQAALARPPGAPADPESSAEGAQRRLLLVVDQFEQLFTQCADEERRRAFITALHAAASKPTGPDLAPGALVVLGVRADFEARCADYPQLAEAVQDRYLVTPMTERQLRIAITAPAKQAGSQVDDDLVEALLAEVRTRRSGTAGAGILPLLSHALDQAWRSRTGEPLTLTDYERTGGIEGAVAASAQRAYDSLTSGQQVVARQVFLRLTATSSDGVDTADRATRAELTEGKAGAEVQDVEAVLETFAAQRLLILAADTVEISHEVLLTAWPLLRDTWLTESHADRIVRTRLHNVAAEWERHSRDPSYLYSGSLLQAAADTAARISSDPARNPPLSQAERDFLHASNRAQRRRSQRRQALMAFLLVLVVGLATVAVLAVHARQQAAQQRNIALSGQLASRSQLVGGTDPPVARLLSIAAWRLNRPSEAARYAMLSAAALPAIRVLPAGSDPVHSVAFSPDGTTLATGGGTPATATSGGGFVQLWEEATGRQTGVLDAGSQPVFAVAFSHDGNIVAGGSGDGSVWLWNAITHQPVGRPLRVGTGPVTSVAFSPQGTILATGGKDGTVRLWDVAAHRQVGVPLTGFSGVVTSVAFSRNGATVAAGGTDGTARLWDVTTHQPVGVPLTGHSGPINSVAFSPDGTTLATAGKDGTVRLWDVAAHRQVGVPLTGGEGPVTSVAFSRNGATVAAGGTDGTARLWDVTTHQPVGVPLTGHSGPINSVAFSPDGTTLATGSSDGTARLWDVTAGRLTGRPLTGHTGPVTSVAFSPDGLILATGSGDGTARLWNVATHRQIGAPLTGGAGPVTSVAFSPDGKILATGSSDGIVWLWDVASHHHIGSALGIPRSLVTSMAFSPDGTILATASSKTPPRQSILNPTSPVWLWNIATHQRIGGPLPGGADQGETSVVFSRNGAAVTVGSRGGQVWSWVTASHQLDGLGAIGPYGPVTSVTYSPDGKTLAVGSLDHTVRFWKASNHDAIGGPLTDPIGPVNSVAFSPDGTIVATATSDGTTQLWDVATHEQVGSPLSGQAAPVTSVAFSPDGTTLATGSKDGTVRLWNVSYLTNVVRHLCAAAGRTLTSSEWARYVGLPFKRLCYFRAATIPAHAVPTLGRFAGLYINNAVGFGQVRPVEIFNGGDPTGLVTHITWKSWGGARAIGIGKALYVGPNQSVANGTVETVTVVAFNLGPCGGKLMYRAVEWYFPQHGQAFNPSQYENICTGD